MLVAKFIARTIQFTIYMTVWCSIGLIIWIGFLVRSITLFSLKVLLASFSAKTVDDTLIERAFSFWPSGLQRGLALLFPDEKDEVPTLPIQMDPLTSIIETFLSLILILFFALIFAFNRLFLDIAGYAYQAARTPFFGGNLAYHHLAEAGLQAPLIYDSVNLINSSMREVPGASISGNTLNVYMEARVSSFELPKQCSNLKNQLRLQIGFARLKLENAIRTKGKFSRSDLLLCSTQTYCINFVNAVEYVAERKCS